MAMHFYQPRTRREMLRHCCGGFGGLALMGMLQEAALRRTRGEPGRIARRRTFRPGPSASSFCS